MSAQTCAMPPRSEIYLSTDLCHVLDMTHFECTDLCHATHILDLLDLFRQNRSTSHCFQNKCIFAFYAEIRDGCQKWHENEFYEKSPVDSADVKYFVEIDLSRTVSEILKIFHFHRAI